MWVRRRVDVRAWRSARQEFAALAAERDHLQAECDQLRADLANVRQQRDDAIDVLNELRAANRRAAMAHARLPVPQPTSSRRPAAGKRAKSNNGSASRRVHRPRNTS
jgi:uncharacterized coiled-coil DUF342 family protein